MSYITNIPLRSRESFFRDPFFSDCWDDMDQEQRDWERQSNLRRNFMNDFDDLDMGLTRGIGHSSLGRMFDRHGHDLLEKNDFLKSSKSSSEGAEVQSDKENFKILLDVQQFTPEELTVKAEENSIVIEGKHEDKKDSSGSVSRHFTRKYTVPADVKIDDVKCNLSSDGVLQVTAPRLNPQITSKASTSSEQKSTEKESASSTSSTSTTKESVEQKRSTPEKKEGRSLEKEETQKESIIGNRLNFDSLRNSDRLRGRYFDSFYDAGFPDFDFVPFWRRRDLAGGQGGIIESHSKNQTSSGVLSDLENFKVQLDVQQFTPEELIVRTVDGTLIIEGKQDEKKDSLGCVSRNFTRKYDIPSDVIPEDIKCKFSVDGHLVITAPRQRPQPTQEKLKESVVPIQIKHEIGRPSGEEKLSTSQRDGEEKLSPYQRWVKEKSASSQQSDEEKSDTQRSIEEKAAQILRDPTWNHTVPVKKEDFSVPFTSSNEINQSSSNQER